MSAHGKPPPLPAHLISPASTTRASGKSKGATTCRERRAKTRELGEEVTVGYLRADAGGDVLAGGVDRYVLAVVECGHMSCG